MLVAGVSNDTMLIYRAGIRVAAAQLHTYIIQETRPFLPQSELQNTNMSLYCSTCLNPTPGCPGCNPTKSHELGSQFSTSVGTLKFAYMFPSSAGGYVAKSAASGPQKVFGPASQADNVSQAAAGRNPVHGSTHPADSGGVDSKLAVEAGVVLVLMLDSGLFSSSSKGLTFHLFANAHILLLESSAASGQNRLISS